MAQTQISEIINDAMVIIDDVRLSQQLSENPALFYRRMNEYVGLSVPLMSSPPELYTYVSSGYSMSLFADSMWLSTPESTTQAAEYDTGYKNFDLCSVSLMSADMKHSTPYSGAAYDPETGIVTFPIQPSEGLTYEIDFYKDGSFSDMSPQIKRLFALAVALMWNERLNNEWLSIHPKIKDSAFDTVNESNWIDKMTFRSKELRREFSDEIKKYEQMVAYERVVHNRKTLPDQL